MGTKVYRYGLLPPDRESEVQVREQLRLAHRYRNQLIEIERWRRAELRTLLSSHGSIPDLEVAVKLAEAEVMRVVTSAKEVKSIMRTRVVSPDHKEALKLAREAKKVASKALSEARFALRADPNIERRTDEINVEANERLKKARGACGVYWGTYLLIEDAHKQSAKMPLYDMRDRTRANDPHFVRWEGEGTLGVQIQKGIAPAELVSSLHARVEDAPLPPGADPQSKKSSKRRYCTLSLRVGSEEDRSPVFARWRMLMHRPMPVDGIIKRAAVHVRRIGPREEWYALFTVTSESDTRPVPDTQERISIDIGWRVQEDGGVRVAAWRTDGGEHGFLVLGPHAISMRDKADELQGIRREKFNEFLPRIVEAVKPLAKPEWWPASLWQWKSLERLHKLVRFWGENRFEGDDEAYLLAEGIHDKERRYESWRYHDHHLWEWESSQRERALRHRREIYRRFAAWAARRYETVVLEEFDLRKVARLPAVDKHEGDNERARSNRQKAATSELRSCIEQAFGPARTVKAPAEYTTMQCHACGSIEQWDQAAEVEHTCGACGAHWDQDDNAARNLLAYREQPDDPEKAGPARKDEKVSDSGEVKESRWVKAKRMGAEKAKRMVAAREAIPTAAE